MKDHSENLVVSGDSFVLAKDLGQEVLGTGVPSPCPPPPHSGTRFGLGLRTKGGQKAQPQPGAFHLGTCVLDFLGQYQFLII